MRFGYSKKEKLKSKKAIDGLFAEGKSFSVFPLKVFWRLEKLNEQTEVTLQAGVVCGKRYFKKAVHRNRVKRLMREAWRLNKPELQQLLPEKNLQLQVFFLFTGNELPTFAHVEEKMQASLKRLIIETNNHVEADI